MAWFRKTERVLSAHHLQEAMREAQEPPHIHNPAGGTRYHFLDPDRPHMRPVCNASGAQWADGDGGLGRCGLCPHMWAQRQSGSDERAAS